MKKKRRNICSQTVANTKPPRLPSAGVGLLESEWRIGNALEMPSVEVKFISCVPFCLEEAELFLSLHFVLSLLTHQCILYFVTFFFLNTQHRTLLSSNGLQKFPHLLRWKTSNKEREVQIHGLKSSLLRLFFQNNIKPGECSFARCDA